MIDEDVSRRTIALSIWTGKLSARVLAYALRAAGRKMLLILAAAVGYLSIEELFTMPSADSYTDRGVYTFVPYEVASEQVKNTSADSRDRRMHPTKTVYMVCYRDIGGSGYRWKERAITPEMGQAVVDAGATVERRVLSIPDRTS